MRAFGIYVHIPFCMRKCNYCDFYSLAGRTDFKAFLSALQKEMAQSSASPPFEGFVAQTLYFGGGTPSLLSTDDFGSILEHLQTCFKFAPDIEVSLEANPGTIQQDELIRLAELGFARVTLGIQSFNQKELLFLTRIHSIAESLSSLKSLRSAGFANIGADLIFGIPGQTLQTWRDTLVQTLEAQVQHVSMYGLTYEPGTALDRILQAGAIVRCDESLEREMYLLGKDLLQSAGLEHYEISNFARPGARSRHNENYWNGTPYLGLGPSAHSFHTHWPNCSPAECETRRWWNQADLDKYLLALANGIMPIQGDEILTRADEMAETILLGLRRKEGISERDWQDRFGTLLKMSLCNALETIGGIDLHAEPFSFSQSEKLLCQSDKSICLTEQGLLLYDSICHHLNANLQEADC